MDNDSSNPQPLTGEQATGEACERCGAKVKLIPVHWHYGTRTEYLCFDCTVIAWGEPCDCSECQKEKPKA